MYSLYAEEKMVSNRFSFRTECVFQKEEVYLNLVLEYIPETVYKVARQYSKSKQTIPIHFIKVKNSTDLEPILSLSIRTLYLLFSAVPINKK